MDDKKNEDDKKDSRITVRVSKVTLDAVARLRKDDETLSKTIRRVVEEAGRPG